MNRVTVYLRTSLFSFSGTDGHLPTGVMAIQGRTPEAGGGSTLRVEVEKLLDERGRSLSEDALSLQLPWSKIDHVVVHSD